MSDRDIKLECIRIASSNLMACGKPFTDIDVVEHATKLFHYIWDRSIKEAA